MEKAYKILFLVIIPEIMASLNPDTDYCALSSCRTPRSHTICAHARDDTIGNRCWAKTILTDKLTDEEKVMILDRHNEIRQIVASGRECRGNPGPQPAALNLQSLEWDDELATIAQRWANQCPYNAINDQCRDVANIEVGQNVAEIDSAVRSDNVKELVDVLYNGVSHFDKTVVDSYRYDGDSRRYAQLVSADTKKVGCGRITTYNEKALYTERYAHILVCNYSPKGLKVDYPVYQASSQPHTGDCYTPPTY